MALIELDPAGFVGGRGARGGPPGSKIAAAAILHCNAVRAAPTLAISVPAVGLAHRK